MTTLVAMFHTIMLGKLRHSAFSAFVVASVLCMPLGCQGSCTVWMGVCVCVCVCVCTLVGVVFRPHAYLPVRPGC